MTHLQMFPNAKMRRSLTRLELGFGLMLVAFTACAGLGAFEIFTGVIGAITEIVQWL